MAQIVFFIFGVFIFVIGISFLRTSQLSAHEAKFGFTGISALLMSIALFVASGLIILFAIDPDNQAVSTVCNGYLVIYVIITILSAILEVLRQKK